jgi:hypothetical protein
MSDCVVVMVVVVSKHFGDLEKGKSFHLESINSEH